MSLLALVWLWAVNEGVIARNQFVEWNTLPDWYDIRSDAIHRHKSTKKFGSHVLERRLEARSRANHEETGEEQHAVVYAPSSENRYSTVPDTANQHLRTWDLL